MKEKPFYIDRITVQGSSLRVWKIQAINTNPSQRCCSHYSVSDPQGSQQLEFSTTTDSKLCSTIAESQMGEVPIKEKIFFDDRIYSSGFKVKVLEDSSHKPYTLAGDIAHTLVFLIQELPSSLKAQYHRFETLLNSCWVPNGGVSS